MYNDYKIILKYYQAYVLESTYETQRIISNESDLQFSFARNMQFEGAFQEFSDTFIFIKEDRDYVISKRDDYLSRKDRGTYLQLEYYSLDRDTVTYNLEYTGKLKFTDVEIPNLYIECQFEVDSVLNRLDAIQEDEITIEKDGNRYSYDISLSAKYNSTKEIFYESNSVTGSESGSFNSIIITGAKMNDADDALENAYSENSMTIYPIDLMSEIIVSSGIVTRLITTYDGSTPTAFTEGTVSLKYAITYGDGGSTLRGTLATITEEIYQIQQVVEVKLTDDYTITLDTSRIVYDENNPQDGTSVSIYGEYSVSESDSSKTIAYEAVMFKNTYNMSVYTTFGDEFVTSAIFANTMRDIIDDYETAQDVTINTDELDGTIYDVNELLLTTSRGIKGISPLNYNISFQDWFNSMKAFIALSLDYISDTIYIKKIEDAYDTSEIIDLTDAINVTTRDNDLNINTFTIGNSGGSSSNFDYADLDPLSTAEYTFGLETENEKTFTNAIRVDGSTINKAAVDYEKVDYSIEDRDDDKDLYMIARDPSETKIVSQFTLVSGVDFQKFGQAINMEFCRSRQLWNWRNYYGHLFTVYSDLQLNSWDKNSELVYTDTDRVDNVIDTPESITDITDDGSSQITPIFGNNLYICEIPQESGTYSLIKANKNKRFRVNYNGVDYIGWLNNVTLSPLTRDVIELELIQSA